MPMYLLVFCQWLCDQPMLTLYQECCQNICYDFMINPLIIELVRVGLHQSGELRRCAFIQVTAKPALVRSVNYLCLYLWRPVSHNMMNGYIFLRASRSILLSVC